MPTAADYLNDLITDDTTLDAKVTRRLDAIAFFQQKITNRLQKLSDKFNTPSPPQVTPSPEMTQALASISTNAATTTTLVTTLAPILAGGGGGGNLGPQPS